MPISPLTQTSPGSSVQPPKDNHADPSTIRGPGLFTIVDATGRILQSAEDLRKATSEGDREKMWKSMIHLAVVEPCLLTDWMVNILSYFTKHPLIGKLTDNLLPVLGLVVACIEGGFEIKNLHQLEQFKSSFFYLNQMPKIEDPQKFRDKAAQWLQKILHTAGKLPANVRDLLQRAEINLISQDFLDMDLLQEIEKALVHQDMTTLHKTYYSLTPAEEASVEKTAQAAARALPHTTVAWHRQQLTKQRLEIKKRSLAGRVRPWTEREITTKIDRLRQQNLSPEGVQQAKELLQDISAQTQKKRIAHILAIVAMIFAIAGLISGLATCPPLAVTLFFLVTCGTLSTARQVFIAGYWDERGWNFNPYNLIPDFAKWIHKKIWSPTLSFDSAEWKRITCTQVIP